MKKTVEVHLTDHEVAVRYEHGDWLVGMKDARWLPLLGAIAEPEKHTVIIKDKRENRQEHQKDLSCERKDDVIANLIDAVAKFGMESNWCDSDIIETLMDCGVTKEDFKRYGFWEFAQPYFEDKEDKGDKYEALAIDIYNWCVEHELWDDNTIYFDGKAWSNLPTWGGDKGAKIAEDLYEYADRNPKHYFEYANPNTLSMSFEGGLNHLLNGYLSGCGKLEEEFYALFHKYGLYHEFGHSWNLSTWQE